ncbi:MAG TPA: dephospho-CoA kinase [Verrucomicrobiae bacterium]|nr:dephospho-CoA kinase [Verrucomicrobiae bacterium]
MKLFGITGGVGMGKSTAGQLLRQRGVEVADTDMLARQLTEPGQPALQEIVQRFGPLVLSAGGQLNRAELARVVFANAGARTDLEAILHPRIRAAWEAEAQGWRAAGREIGAILIPLLFETGAETRFDAIICVACSEASQWQRLRARSWSDDQIRQRVAAQWPVEKKIARSDFVVWTDTTLEIHAGQLERVVFQRPLTSSAASGAPV